MNSGLVLASQHKQQQGQRWQAACHDRLQQLRQLHDAAAASVEVVCTLGAGSTQAMTVCDSSGICLKPNNGSNSSSNSSVKLLQRQRK
jgi:hypothetical protein